MLSRLWSFCSLFLRALFSSHCSLQHWFSCPWSSSTGSSGEASSSSLLTSATCLALSKWRPLLGSLLLLFLELGVRLFSGVWVNTGVCLLLWSEVFVCGVHMLLLTGDKFEWEETLALWMLWLLAADNVKWCLCGVLWAVLEDCKLGTRAVFGRLFAWLLLSLWLLWSVSSEGSNEVDSAERGAAGTCT